MQRRGLLIGTTAVLGFCLLACVLVFVTLLPSFRSGIRDGVHDAVATEVARQLAPVPGGPAEPGTYTINAADLQAGLLVNIDQERDQQELVVRITPEQLEVGLTSSGQDAIYSGTPVAENGELRVRDMTTENGLVRFFLPPDTISGAIESALNDYLEANNLRLENVILAEGTMTLVVVNR